MFGLVELEYYTATPDGDVIAAGSAMLNPEDIVLAQECKNMAAFKKPGDLPAWQVNYNRQLEERSMWFIQMRGGERFIVEKKYVDKFKCIE